MTSFDELNTNTMQWFDGEDNQNPSVSSGNTQLPNPTSSFSPLIFGLMNNQATRQPDLPVFDDIDILTYLMQADSENILAANSAASTSGMDSIVSGDIVPMPTITEHVDIQPIKMESVSDHVPPAYGSESGSPPAHSPPQQQQGSPSHPLDNDETDWRPDPETLKKMTSKERRQLRNKISARNFRVRRKEYISTLEEQVKDCDDRNKELQKKNRALQEENNKLKAELKRLRQKHGEPETELTGVESDTETVPPVTPPSSNHSDDNSSPHSLTSSSSSFSPQQAAEILDLDFMDLYASADATPNTFASFISQAVMPNWDVPSVLKGKSSDGTLTIANATRAPVALMRDYPLLAPALLSIVVNHTFNMNYLAFSNGNFPYNEQLPAYQDNGMVVADVKRSDSLSPGLDGLSPDELDLLWDVLNKRYQTAADTPDGPIKDEELRHLSTIKEKLMKERKFRQTRALFWHTLWKLQGLDDEAIKEKYEECAQCHLQKEVQRKLKMEKKAAKSCSEDCSPRRRHMTWSEKKQKIASFKIRIM